MALRLQLKKHENIISLLAIFISVSSLFMTMYYYDLSQYTIVFTQQIDENIHITRFSNTHLFEYFKPDPNEDGNLIIDKHVAYDPDGIFQVNIFYNEFTPHQEPDHYFEYGCVFPDKEKELPVYGIEFAELVAVTDCNGDGELFTIKHGAVYRYFEYTISEEVFEIDNEN